MTTDTENTQALAPVDERAELAAEIAADPQRERMSFPEWYLAVLGNCDAAEERLREQYNRMRAAIDARRKALEWRFGSAFRAQVEADLAAQKGKKKSVSYLTGNAGFRKTRGRLIFKDGEALKVWCAENLPDGLKLELSKTAISEHIKVTGEVPPGAEWEPESDKFYPAVERPELTEEDGNGE